MIEVQAVRTDGLTKTVVKSHVAALAPAGGSPDGALTSVPTPEKRTYTPVAGPMLRPNDHIQIKVVAPAADGIDVSDCIWLLPVTEYDSQGRVVCVKTLAIGDFTDPAPADYTTVANIPTIVGAYKVTEAGLRIGGGPIYIDIQDDT